GRTLKAEHREAEASGSYLLSFSFDNEARRVRVRAFEDELHRRVDEYMDEHPTASANEVDDAVEGNRQRILELVRERRPEGGSGGAEPPGTTSAGSVERGGSARRGLPQRGSPLGTTPADSAPEVVPDAGTGSGEEG